MKQKWQIGDYIEMSKTITDDIVQEFAEITGDYNPLHIDDGFAAHTRFKKRVCHGMLVASYVSAILGMKLPGPGCIYLEQEIKFLRPVYIGDTITASVKVTDIMDNGVMIIETTVLDMNGNFSIIGNAKVLAPL